MSLDPGLAGRTFEPTPPYTVSKEKIAEFNRAIGAEPVDDGLTAPLTFAIVVSFGAMTQLMTDPDVEQTRPIHAGDELVATITIDTLRAAAGMDMIGTRTEVATTAGEHVVTAYATLVHRGGAG